MDRTKRKTTQSSGNVHVGAELAKKIKTVAIWDSVRVRDLLKDLIIKEYERVRREMVRREAAENPK